MNVPTGARSASRVIPLRINVVPPVALIPAALKFKLNTARDVPPPQIVSLGLQFNCGRVFIPMPPHASTGAS